MTSTTQAFVLIGIKNPRIHGASKKGGQSPNLDTNHLRMTKQDFRWDTENSLKMTSEMALIHEANLVCSFADSEFACS
jgi:hypothetical protein